MKWLTGDIQRYRILLLAGVSLFGALYFIMPDAKLQRILFYLLLPLVLILADWRGLFRYTAMWIIIAYIGYQAASLSWSHSWSWQEEGEVLRKGVLSLLWLIMAITALQYEQSARCFWQALTISASVSAGAALWLHYGIELAPLEERMTGLGRSLNPVQGGCLYGLTMIAAIYLGQEEREPKWLWIGCWLILLLAVLATGSRGALLATLLAQGVLLVLKLRRWHHYILPLAAIGILLANIVNWQDFLARADSFRFILWQKAIDDWLTQPWFGLGFRTAFSVTLPYGAEITHPHSIYITALYYGGLIGLGLLITLLGILLWYVWEKRATMPFALALLMYGAVIGLVDFNLLLVNSQIEWLLFWLPWAMAIATQHKGKYAHTA